MVNYKNQTDVMFPRLSSKCTLKIQSSDVNITTMHIGSEHTENSHQFQQDSLPVPVKTINSDLSKYLNRPVLIETINWLEEDNFDSEIYPWYLYFNHPSIKKRLDNYAFLKCKLNIRVVITASPFYYGAGQVSYHPYFDEGVCQTGAPGLVPNSHLLLTRSQRPSFNIYPQESMGGEMILPFLFHKEFALVTSPADLKLLGALRLRSFFPLRNANSVAGQAATIQVFAWAEDVELSAPTVNLALQSRDEYTGIISKPASALAYYAGRLTDIPVIGRYATATSLASGTIAAIAAMFGYTNVPNIDKQAAFRPTSTPLLATTDIGVAVEKLTIDSKNELTIDNSAYSCGDSDPLVIKSMCARESYLTSFEWTSTDAPQQALWNSRVTPNLCANQSYAYGTLGATGNIISMTPMCMVANLFKYWRGDIKFRFVFVCSQYHRGKVRIAWDPLNSIGTDFSATTGYTEVYNKVVDLSEEKDVSITIPYNQATAFLSTGSSTTIQTDVYGSAFLNPRDYNNGVISVIVLNKQTSPVASANITTLVYVSAIDIDFETPKSIPNYYSPYPLQSRDTELDSGSVMNLFETKGEDKHLNLVYMGEKILSLRQLMRRSNFINLMNCTEFYVLDTVVNSVINRMPLYPGFDPNGITEVYKQGETSVITNFNYVQFSTVNWISQCFVGYRGSLIWNVNVNGPNLITSASIRRSEDTLVNTSYIRADYYDSGSEPPAQKSGLERNKYSQNGVSLVNGRVQQALSILAPWYSNFKFAATTALQRTLGRSTFGTTTDSLQTTVVVNATTAIPASKTQLEFYCGAGTDYDPVFFLNVPTLYYKSTLPAAVY